MGRKITKSKTQAYLDSFHALEQHFPQIQSQLIHKLDEELLTPLPIDDLEAAKIQSYTRPLQDSIEKYKKTFASFLRTVKDIQETDEETFQFKETVSATMAKINQLQDDLESQSEQTADKIMIHNMTLGYFSTNPGRSQPAVNSEPEEKKSLSNE